MGPEIVDWSVVHVDPNWEEHTIKKVTSNILATCKGRMTYAMCFSITANHQLYGILHELIAQQEETYGDESWYHAKVYLLNATDYGAAVEAKITMALIGYKGFTWENI
jgi:hypothetical protein